MIELNGAFEGHWLSRIDEYRHTPRIYFGIGAISKLGDLATEIARKTNAVIITDKTLRKIGLIEGPQKSLEKAGFTVDIYETEVKEPELTETKQTINALRAKDYGLVIVSLWDTATLNDFQALQGGIVK
jgi:alcohol dehydrogenase class IV